MDSGYYVNFDEDNGWYSEVERRCESILPDLRPEFVAGLDEASLICLDVLIPSVCRGEAKNVRALLLSTAAGGKLHDAKEAVLKANVDNDDDETLAPLREDPSFIRKSSDVDLQPYVNFVCPASRVSVLFLASAAGECDVVCELLDWGADPSWGRTNRHGHLTNTVLSAALSSCNAKICQPLVTAGAKVNSLAWDSMAFYCSTAEIFKVLSDDGKNPCPIDVAADITDITDYEEEDFTHEDFTRLCKMPGRVYWRKQCLRLGRMRDQLAECDSVKDLICVKAVAPVEKVCKALFVQDILLGLCRPYYEYRYGQNPEILLAILLQEGASIHGWTYHQARAMRCAYDNLILSVIERERDEEAAEEQGEHQEEEDHCLEARLDFGRAASNTDITLDSGSIDTPAGYFNFDWYFNGDCWMTCPDCQGSDVGNEGVDTLTPFSYHCLLPSVLWYDAGNPGTGVADHPDSKYLLMEKFFGASCVPWLTSPDLIPCTRQRAGTGAYLLHDGPTCSSHVSLAEEQMQISLRMCTRSGGVLQSLQSLCRDAILSALPMRDILSEIQQLPLPDVRKDYMLSSK